MNLKNYYPVFGLIIFITLFQVIVTVSGYEFFLTQLTMSAYYVIVILGLCILMGYAGQISIGHAAFFAIGGYTTAVLTTYNFINYSENWFIKFAVNAGITITRVDTYGKEILHFSPWLALFVAILITFIISFLIGIPILKLKGHYLAMATLGFGIIIYRVLLGSSIFGEADGISDVPPFKIFGGLEINGNIADRVENYYIVWIIVIFFVVMLVNIINSRVGRAMRSIHGSEEAANSMGVNPAKFKLILFVFSAVMAAVAGVFMTHYNAGIGPSESGVSQSVRYVAIVAVGGMSNLWGALIMGIVLNYFSLRGYFGSYDEAVFGTILILIMLFAPDGIFNSENFNKFKNFIKRKG